MSDPHTSSAAVEGFRLAVDAEFGEPWTTEPTADGFVAVFPLGRGAAEGFTASDEVHVRVAVDEAARTFAFTTRRIAGSDLDRERQGWGAAGYRYSREFESTRYTGRRRTMVFSRTPEGLVPAPESPQDSAGREADLRAVAARLGWSEDAPAPSGGLNLAVGLPPKRQLVVIGVFFGVVLLVIGGVAVFVVSQVAGAFLR